MRSSNNKPDFESQLLAEMGRINMNIVVKAVGDNEAYFSELVRLILQGKHPVNMRAAWALTICLENHPEWLAPHLKKLLEILEQPVHPGIRRCILRSIANMDIPKKWEGFLVHHCFDWLLSSAEPIAVKAFSMQILYKLSLVHPEIQDELCEAIESIFPQSSSGMKSAGTKILNMIARQKRQSHHRI